MKKQKQKTINPTAMPEMVNHHKMREVTPSQAASQNLEADGRPLDKVKQLQTWFKTAKVASGHSDGFLGVAKKEVSIDSGTDKSMLYKGKKK